MTRYIAPLREMQFVIHELVGLQRTACRTSNGNLCAETVDMLLDEAARFTQEVIAPLNATGDRDGAHWVNGNVTTPPGFKHAYQRYVENGWNALRCDPQYGGHGIGHLAAIAVEEMLASANLSFALIQALNMGAVEALQLSASTPIKDRFLAELVAGKWTGTMNLTEPQAGSDLGAIRTRAIAEGEHFRLYGQKCFITYGEHDLAENILHLVLARTPDAPKGTRGLSLFLVPKYLVNDDGSLGDRNDVCCISIEHKLGIHACPTATLSFGDNQGAIGYLIGDLNAGLRYMFIMMNLSRLNSALQGPALGERAYQQALDYARTRAQGSNSAGHPVAIIQHADVKRMLLMMTSQVEAMRALVYCTAERLDIATRIGDEEGEQQLRRAELLTPVAKGWCTEVGQEVVSLGVQVHGGVGYIEETGAAQHLRDMRIASIYEGTTGIQASDLLLRKVVSDRGAMLMTLLTEMHDAVDSLADKGSPTGGTIALALRAAIVQFSSSVDHLLGQERGVQSALAVPFLMQFGYLCGGWMMVRSASIACENTTSGTAFEPFYAAKLRTALFYTEHVLPKAAAYASTVNSSARCVLDFEPGLD
ncbi:acyl-CoA dehydrogenase [Pseudomonas vancouverensis]|uniref:3-methylmercaptopropionyl-CoA dehydrogenase n=4 Tax=Pseudomonas vancouverensis TaxID=95300 RepID=A0A1H2MEW0_PSEVA|nr:acyl-CoA dehydrogenase [Pseudomonas vancouverensis]KAB0499170.1 acyl-CoA dehydrogenase [Pseudomonas vancouverensis]TDB59895.1 acyl-CoA dehydrogenase [Pseudomonas vancouverensis]SDU91498.1 acyl-CoA dehydrogenase [Pseudomonas vancouverensis]